MSLGVSGSGGVEVSGVVPGVVPTGWLGTGVLPETSMVISREAVVSDGVVKGPSEVSVTSRVVEEEVVLVPGDVLPSSVVMAGPWWGLVPSVVPTPVEERRAEVRGGSVLISTPKELTARAMLVPTDVKVVVLSQSGVMATEVGAGVLVVVSPSRAGVLLVVASSPAGALLVVSPSPAEVLLVVSPSPAGALLVVSPNPAEVLLVVSPNPAGALLLLVVSPSCAGVVLELGSCPVGVMLVVMGPSPGDTGVL